jgi:hypothetical protein
MLRRYREIKEDMPLSAAKIEDDTLSATILQQVLILTCAITENVIFY